MAGFQTLLAKPIPLPCKDRSSLQERGLGGGWVMVVSWIIHKNISAKNGSPWKIHHYSLAPSNILSFRLQLPQCLMRLPPPWLGHSLISYQETRKQLFNDYVDCNRDTMAVEARFEQKLEESQRSQVRYGFRNDVWLIKHHGERKANKIMVRKKELGLILAYSIGGSSKHEVLCPQQSVTT